jgi:hypothetical protein
MDGGDELTGRLRARRELDVPADVVLGEPAQGDLGGVRLANELGQCRGQGIAGRRVDVAERADDRQAAVDYLARASAWRPER